MRPHPSRAGARPWKPIFYNQLTHGLQESVVSMVDHVYMYTAIDVSICLCVVQEAFK